MKYEIREGRATVDGLDVRSVYTVYAKADTGLETWMAVFRFKADANAYVRKSTEDMCTAGECKCGEGGCAV